MKKELIGSAIVSALPFGLGAVAVAGLGALVTSFVFDLFNENNMALTKEDKTFIINAINTAIEEKVPKIIEEKVPKIIEEKVPKIIEKKLKPLSDKLGTISERQSSMAIRKQLESEGNAKLLLHSVNVYNPKMNPRKKENIGEIDFIALKQINNSKNNNNTNKNKLILIEVKTSFKPKHVSEFTGKFQKSKLSKYQYEPLGETQRLSYNEFLNRLFELAELEVPNNNSIEVEHWLVFYFKNNAQEYTRVQRKPKNARLFEIDSNNVEIQEIT